MSEIDHEKKEDLKGTKKSVTDSSIISKKRVYSRKSYTKTEAPKKTKAVNICFCTVSLRLTFNTIMNKATLTVITFVYFRKNKLSSGKHCNLPTLKTSTILIYHFYEPYMLSFNIVSTIFIFYF